jgi:hypothetical protein
MRVPWLVMLVVLGSATLAAPLDAQRKPDWQTHCDACLGYYTSNPAEVHCQDDYTATYPECLVGGGRACLMVRAVAAAKANDCDKAFKLTLMCQCHDGTAQEHLRAAGPRAVCGYLMAK